MWHRHTRAHMSTLFPSSLLFVACKHRLLEYIGSNQVFTSTTPAHTTDTKPYVQIVPGKLSVEMRIFQHMGQATMVQNTFFFTGSTMKRRLEYTCIVD